MRVASLRLSFFGGMLLCLPMASWAQTTQIDRQLSRADSLTLHFQWVAAEAIVDRLLADQLADTTRTKVLLLKGRLREKALVNDEAIAFALKALKRAEAQHLYETACGAHLTLALVHEHADNFSQCRVHLDAAQQLMADHGLPAIHPHYHVRRASYYRQSGLLDSALIHAHKALELGTLHDQYWHLTDAHYLLAFLYRDTDAVRSIHHFTVAAKRYRSTGLFQGESIMYYGIAKVHASQNNLDLAFRHIDSAMVVHSLSTEPVPHTYFRTKADLFKRTGQYDSAFAYIEKQFAAFSTNLEQEKRVEVARLNAVHENEKQQEALEGQVQINHDQKVWLLRSLALTLIIVVALVLLILAYRKLRSNNLKINAQSQQLENTLNRQKMLLAELQHRVKNNLQVIIALLHLQNEDTTGKSIAELTKESQKRIESMAFLHDKIYLSENLEKVNLQTYLEEVTSLLYNTYSTTSKRINIEIDAQDTNVSIDKAVPLGLITVELLINSFKHAFNGRDTGTIRISTRQANMAKYAFELTYQDNGNGFGSEMQQQGLGMKIITGLVGQLHGKIDFDGTNGFRVKLLF